MKKKDEELQDAEVKNKVKKQEDLTRVPGTDLIYFHKIRSFFTGNCTGSNMDILMLINYHCPHVEIMSIRILFIVMDKSSLSKSLKPYIPLILKAIDKCLIDCDEKNYFPKQNLQLMD